MDYAFVTAAFSIAIKLVAGGMILFFAEVKHRKTSLPWGLAWIAYAYAIAGDISGNYIIGAMSVAIFASLIFYGTTRLIGAEFYIGKVSRIIALLPMFFVILLVSGALMLPRNLNLLIMGVSHAVSGLFMILSGFLLLELREIYGKKAKNLGITLIIYGIHQVDYLALRNEQGFATVGFVLGLILTVVSALLMIQFVLVTPFGPKSARVHEKIQKGVLILRLESIEGYMDLLRDYPVLAFVRTISTPNKWTTFKLSNVPGKLTIEPTNLPRILETAVEYMKRAREDGDSFRPVILIEGLEYLRLYNDFSSIAKFLATLKDYVSVNEGTLIVVLDEKAWEKKEFHLLTRILT